MTLLIVELTMQSFRKKNQDPPDDEVVEIDKQNEDLERKYVSELLYTGCPREAVLFKRLSFGTRTGEKLRLDPLRQLNVYKKELSTTPDAEMLMPFRLLYT